MSSDNGIYILHTSDGYRVTHANAIENLWWWDEDSGYRDTLNPKYILEYFGSCSVFNSIDEALKEANRIYQDITKSGLPLEYGIQIIEYFDVEFSELMVDKGATS